MSRQEIRHEIQRGVDRLQGKLRPTLILIMQEDDSGIGGDDGMPQGVHRSQTGDFEGLRGLKDFLDDVFQRNGGLGIQMIMEQSLRLDQINDSTRGPCLLYGLKVIPGPHMTHQEFTDAATALRGKNLVDELSATASLRGEQYDGRAALRFAPLLREGLRLASSLS